MILLQNIGIYNWSLKSDPTDCTTTKKNTGFDRYTFTKVTVFYVEKETEIPDEIHKQIVETMGTNTTPLIHNKRTTVVNFAIWNTMNSAIGTIERADKNQKMADKYHFVFLLAVFDLRLTCNLIIAWKIWPRGSTWLVIECALKCFPWKRL